MANLLSIIRAKLLADDVATVLWTCFIGYYPDTGIDQLLALNLTGGYPQDTHDGNNVFQNFQVTVRAARTDYTVCESKWLSVFNCLSDANLIANDVYLIQAMSS